MQTIGINPEFWSGRRVFVTGHTGFIGGWLCLWLTRLGAQLAGYSLAPPTKPSLFETASIGDDMCSLIADIRDGEQLSAAMREFAPDIVLHLAAQSLVRPAHANPVETFSTNPMGTVNLMQAIHTTESVRTALIMTTDKVYENREWPWGYREKDRLGGKEPYAASKACAELVVEAYRQSYFGAGDQGNAAGKRALGIATVRAGNVIGGGDWATDRLIPDAVRAFSQDRKMIIRNPASVRPWQHALEPVSGILTLAERLSADTAGFQGAWNFGPAEDGTHSVATVADALARLWGNGAGWAPENPDAGAPYEAGLLTLNSSKAHNMLGWNPVWQLERALGATIEWYKSHLAMRDMRKLSFDQIAAYQGAN